MLRDIALGQYFPGNSVLHRTDPRIKIVLTMLYIVAVFTAESLLSYLVMFCGAVLLIAVSRIPLKIVTSGFKTILFIIIFTAILNIFWTKGENLLASFWVIEIYSEGLIHAGKMVLRLACLLMGTSVLISYTTSPIALTDGLERLLSPLKVIKLPVHEFAMMMTIALRFIPTLIEETDKIMNAQKARGADFTEGNILQRAKALIPILIPLFVSAFMRAGELATAMECRCYHGGEGRTRMTVLKTKPLDWILLLVFAAYGVAIILVRS
ncbi:MAG: energy-coupling factor transporter transmembrane protein EcfT [Clostridia bacterium]|nr:energy-coupling factor transporter transmembrane protein EcfT [Clostridia bacterium]